MPPLPTIAQLLAERRLSAQAPDKRALEQSLEAADRDLEAAAANVPAYGQWADSMLYEAGLRSARALVQAAGYRIHAGAGAHRTAIDAADVLTEERHHRLFVRLHRMRRRRNDFMYETAPDPSAADLASARADVIELIAIARQAVSRLG